MMRPIRLMATVIFAIMTFTGSAWATEAAAPAAKLPTLLSAGGQGIVGAASKLKIQKSIVLADRRRRRHRHRGRSARRIVGGVAAGIAAAIIAKELSRSSGYYDHEQRCEHLEWRCDEGSRSACRRYDTYCD